MSILLPPIGYKIPVPFYGHLIPPLNNDLESHALLTFAIKAARMLNQTKKPQLESEADYNPLYKNLYINTCHLYNVSPDKTWNYWVLVEKVFVNIEASLPSLIRSQFIPKGIIIN